MEEAERLTRNAKGGTYNAASDGFTSADLINFEYIINQGINAGLSAALISTVLKIAPEVCKCLDQLIDKGFVDINQLKKTGLAALSGSCQGFLYGFVASSLTATCKSGILGTVAQSISKECISGLTVIVINTIKDSLLVSKGELTQGELTYNLSRNIFVTSCAVGLGFLTQLAPIIPCAYLLGNFIGTLVGSFIYDSVDKVIMSFCIVSEFTLFGLVEQDYHLPEEVLNQLGIDLFEYEKFYTHRIQTDQFPVKKVAFNVNECDTIRILRRGVISVHKVGYFFDIKIFPTPTPFAPLPIFLCTIKPIKPLRYERR